MSHTHRKHSRLINYFGLVTISVFGVVSILGTGGGDGNNIPPVTYTGLTTQAQITADNALPFGEVAFLGVSAGTSISYVGVETNTQDQTRSASIVSIARILHDIVSDIDVNSSLSSIPVGWVLEVFLPGTCGGSVSGSEEIDESLKTFTGRLVFNNFCVMDFYIDGTITYSGECDPGTFDIDSQTCDPIVYIMTFTTFNTHGWGESETMTGTIATTVTSSTSYVSTLNLLFRDDNANVTYKYENYIITVTEVPFVSDTVEVSGTVYHPAYGFVDVSTTTPIEFSSGLDSPPESGVMLLTGADGTGGAPTTATFTFGFGMFTIEVDTDGDGSPNNTFNCTWEPNVCV